MDINEPPLWTLHMTRSIRLDGPVLIEVAYSPSSEGARAGLFCSNSGRVS